MAADTAWRARRPAQHWQVDFGAPRELNGAAAALGRRRARHATSTCSAPTTASAGDRARACAAAARDMHALCCPETETRHLRLALQRGPRAGYALADVQADRARASGRATMRCKSLAARAPRGRYPRAFVGEQNYWTLVGVDGGGAHAALISEDGAIEPRRGGPSHRAVRASPRRQRSSSWADVQHRARAARRLPADAAGALDAPAFTLDIEAARRRPPRARAAARALHAAPTPATRARTLELRARAAAVAGQSAAAVSQHARRHQPGAHARMAAATRCASTAAPWLHALDAAGRRVVRRQPSTMATRWSSQPRSGRCRSSPMRHGSRERRAALAIELAPASRAGRRGAAAGGRRAAASAPPTSHARLDAVAAHWRERLNRVQLTLPPQAQPIADTLAQRRWRTS